MENKMTDELNIFIDKLQRIAMELYDEYNSLERNYFIYSWIRRSE